MASPFTASRFFYYSNNGIDESNNTLDMDITGNLTRLGIEHPRPAFHLQGRWSIIERLNSILPAALLFGTGVEWKNRTKTGMTPFKLALNTPEPKNGMK
ncbi:MAG: hypothetical protein ACTS73_01600 [Arsenophonus sp. NEOnobi-MAG3]